MQVGVKGRSILVNWCYAFKLIADVIILNGCNEKHVYSNLLYVG